jgi:hypothetical protein
MFRTWVASWVFTLGTIFMIFGSVEGELVGILGGMFLFAVGLTWIVEIVRPHNNRCSGPEKRDAELNY